MFDGLGRARPAPDIDLITRAVALPALAALAVIHVVDLPGTSARTGWSGSAISGSSRSRSWRAEP